jgi:arsenate reductase (thioredoxin)
MKPAGILFLDPDNGIRSQIAEGFARAFAPHETEIYSAGSEPTALHPFVVRVMGEVGIDVSHQYGKAISEVPTERVSLVVTLCRETVWCEIPCGLRHCYCVFEEPARSKTPEELLRACAEVRDQLGAILRPYFGRRRIYDGSVASVASATRHIRSRVGGQLASAGA